MCFGQEVLTKKRHYSELSACFSFLSTDFEKKKTATAKLIALVRFSMIINLVQTLSVLLLSLFQRVALFSAAMTHSAGSGSVP